MRNLLAVAVAVCGVLTFSATAADDKKPAEQPKKDDKPAASKKFDLIEYKLRDAKLAEKKDGKVSEPTVIKTEEELAKAIGEDAAKAMKFDFKGQYLALFQWSGSGGDELTHSGETVDGKKVVTTTLKPGRTKDLKQHAALIGLPAGAEWKMAK